VWVRGCVGVCGRVRSVLDTTGVRRRPLVVEAAPPA
jgi:hypothetical protein